MEKTRIFVIESDPSMVALYEKVFSLNGHEVVVALGSKDAITKLEVMDKKPAVIVVDIMVDDLGGFDVLKYIKEKDTLKNVPVVVATHLADESDAEKAFELGAVLYLVKSQYEPAELVEKVKEIIEGYSKNGGVVPEVKVPVREMSE